MFVAKALWWVAAAASSAEAKRPSFIMYQPDEMRAEALGCYGHPTSKTPNFDSFAAQGTRFDQTHVSYTVCSQSRVSFMTGWPTHVNGHRSLWALLHDWEPNLLKYFKEHDYTVKWWGKNDLLASDAWNNSVTSARSFGGGNNGKNLFKFGEAGYYSFLNGPYEGKAENAGDYKNVVAAINFLKNQPKDEPFVIFLPLMKPHPPYSCPEPWYSSIDPDTLPPLRPIGDETKPDYHKLIREYTNTTTLDEAHFRKLHAVYLGSISFSDFLFGLLMAALDDSPFADSTTVSVFADHGDYAGDYGLVEKWPSGLEDVLTRVPLIVRTPGGKPGHVVNEPVQLFDIVPTLLDIADIPLEHVQFGRSLKSQLNGESGDPQRAVFAEGGYSSLEPRDLEGDPSQGDYPKPESIYYYKVKLEQERPESVMRSAMVRTMTHKLVVRTDPNPVYDDHCSELYDLELDPQELHNVYSNESYTGVKAELTDRLFKWFMQTSDVTRWQVDSRQGHWTPPNANQDLSAPSQNPDDFAEYSFGKPELSEPLEYRV